MVVYAFLRWLVFVTCAIGVNTLLCTVSTTRARALSITKTSINAAVTSINAAVSSSNNGISNDGSEESVHLKLSQITSLETESNEKPNDNAERNGSDGQEDQQQHMLLVCVLGPCPGGLFSRYCQTMFFSAIIKSPPAGQLPFSDQCF
jgi:hypothetical protein